MQGKISTNTAAKCVVFLKLINSGISFLPLLQREKGEQWPFIILVLANALPIRICLLSGKSGRAGGGGEANELCGKMSGDMRAAHKRKKNKKKEGKFSFEGDN